MGESSYIVIKNLRKVWPIKPRKEVIIVDDTASTYSKNYGNAIPINTYDGSGRCDELLRCIEILERLRNIEDVRMIRKT